MIYSDILYIFIKNVLDKIYQRRDEMKRIVLVFIVCVVIILLMNCSQGGGGYSSDTNSWIAGMNYDLAAARLDRVESEISKLRKRLFFLESELETAEQQNEHLLQRILVLETANLIREM